jgi:cyanophycinase
MTRRFLLLGAGEFLPWAAAAERAVLAEARDGYVAVVPTASAPEGDAVFDRWARLGLEHYGSLGLEARLVPLKTREDALAPAVVESIAGAALVFFSGGNPLHLARVLEGTPFLSALSEAIAGGAVFGGCSAGAMVAGAREEGRALPDFRHVGLGLVPGVRFGVHWNRMPGFLPGLKELIVSGGSRQDTFIGIDENTAITGDGSRWQVFGAGSVDVRKPSGRTRYRAGEEFATA